jgi:hypothetical protein
VQLVFRFRLSGLDVLRSPLWVFSAPVTDGPRRVLLAHAVHQIKRAAADAGSIESRFGAARLTAENSLRKTENRKRASRTLSVVIAPRYCCFPALLEIASTPLHPGQPTANGVKELRSDGWTRYMAALHPARSTEGATARSVFPITESAVPVRRIPGLDLASPICREPSTHPRPRQFVSATDSNTCEPPHAPRPP